MFVHRPATRGITMAQVVPALGRKIQMIHPGEATTVRRILSMCLLLAMIGLAGGILLPLIMGLALR